MCVTLLFKPPCSCKRCLQVTDISQLGDPKAVARLLLPPGATVLSYATEAVPQPPKDTGTVLGVIERDPVNYYRCVLATSRWGLLPFSLLCCPQDGAAWTWAGGATSHGRAGSLHPPAVVAAGNEEPGQLFACWGSAQAQPFQLASSRPAVPAPACFMQLRGCAPRRHAPADDSSSAAGPHLCAGGIGAGSALAGVRPGTAGGGAQLPAAVPRLSVHSRPFRRPSATEMRRQVPVECPLWQFNAIQMQEQWQGLFGAEMQHL